MWASYSTGCGYKITPRRYPHHILRLEWAQLRPAQPITAEALRSALRFDSPQRPPPRTGRPALTTTLAATLAVPLALTPSSTGLASARPQP
ncbi:putative oxidosqualene cyclase [Frankliniella fusca]|uniref:Oxidosqualene cyclase n=1 Tax=Frankliniella fusca TaxID=407009 RepID=A0AAE1L8P5_9NEOP|nr:putative oxidosqualene cyclase [Frankliniella fusca]